MEGIAMPVLDSDTIDALRKYKDFVQTYYIDGVDSIPPVIEEKFTIEGALCLDTGIEGSTVAINAMMHINEPAGLAAQMDIIEKWQQGDRPASGKILLSVGHRPRAIIAFLEDIITRAAAGESIEFDRGHYPDDIKLLFLGGSIYAETQGRVLDIHSTAGNDDAMILPCISALKSEDKDSEATGLIFRIAPIIAKLVTSSDYTLTQEDQAIIEKYQNAATDNKQTTDMLYPSIKNMPLNHVLLDYYKDSLLTPQYAKVFFKMLLGKPLEALPLVLETGGPNLLSHHHNVAVESACAYTHAHMGWPKHVPNHRIDGKRNYYTEIQSVGIPRPENKAGEEQKDQPTESYLLLHNAADIPDAIKAKANIDWDTIKPGRLNNFVYIEQGVPIAIGEETGEVIYAPKSGYAAIAPSHSVKPEEAEGTGLLFIASNKVKEKDMLADRQADVTR